MSIPNNPVNVPVSSGRVPLGTIIRAHGLRGVVRVRPHDSSSEALGEAQHVFLVPPPLSPTRLTSGSKVTQHTVVSALREREEWLLKLEGVDDRDAAEALRGRSVEVPRETLREPEDDEVYVADL